MHGHVTESTMKVNKVFQRIGPKADSLIESQCLSICLSPFHVTLFKASHWPSGHMIRSDQEQVRSQFLVDKIKIDSYFRKILRISKWKRKCVIMTNMDTVYLESTAGNIISKICQSLSSCSNKNVCNKRHPRPCKRLEEDVLRTPPPPPPKQT